MTEDPPSYNVEITFVATPPAQKLARASGVTEVDVDGRTLRCVVCGTFQPFLEALHGHEVTALTSLPRTLEAGRRDTGHEGSHVH